MHTFTNTNVHFDARDVVGANVHKLTDSCYALNIGTSDWKFVSLFVTKQQLADIFRDAEVLYMTEILGASEKDVMFP